MPLRPPAGFISANYDPLNVANAPTIGTATGGDAQASVAFTAPSNTGGSAITAYYAVSNPGQVTASGASSPITVTGLTNGTAYTFQVWALNSYGPSPYSAASGSVTPSSPIAVFGGGGNNVLNYFTIATAGNATDFGDLLYASTTSGACSSSTRGVFAEDSTNTLNYLTFSSVGNASDFGDLNNTKYGRGSCSNSTRGLFGGGDGGGYSNVIDYITIATTGNATDFGDLTVARGRLTSTSSPTRGLFCCGENASSLNIIDYVTIASTGNATDFGDFTKSPVSNMDFWGACSSSTRAIIAPGDAVSAGYVTIASTGDSSTFGTLSGFSNRGIAGTSNNVRGVFAGSNTNTISYFTIATTGNSTDFGDLLTSMDRPGACSNGHGGLQ